MAMRFESEVRVIPLAEHPSSPAEAAQPAALTAHDRRVAADAPPATSAQSPWPNEDYRGWASL